jgi:hypothetical protein
MTKSSVETSGPTEKKHNDNGQIERFETSGPIEKKAECIMVKLKALKQVDQSERKQNVS